MDKHSFRLEMSSDPAALLDSQTFPISLGLFPQAGRLDDTHNLFVLITRFKSLKDKRLTL